MLVKPEHGSRILHDHAHLVVVFAAGQAGAVRRRANLDQEDRRFRKRRYFLRHRVDATRARWLRSPDPRSAIVGLRSGRLLRCQRCDQGERRPVRRAKLVERDRGIAVVLEVPMEECEACGERWLPWDIAGRLDELVTAIFAVDVEIGIRHFDGPGVSLA